MSAVQKKYMLVVLGILVAAILCMTFANIIQTDNGRVSITGGTIQTDKGDLTYRLYLPDTATAAAPAPAVLLLHGYQNDHETCAAYAIELARRGAVVMALDEYGHGSTTVGMRERGYVNHKVTVNYGNDSESDGTYVSIGGQLRYKVMMNFSNLSFFDDHYSADADGNVLTDSSAGGIAAYAVLADMPEVDSSRMAISGHSMGTWSSWSTAAAYSGTEIEPKATVLQCGELFRDSAYDAGNIHFNNVLLLQAKWDEFSYFRDYKSTVTDALLTSPLRLEFLDCDPADAAWNTTYGSFSDGTARRIQLLYTNHRLTTHHSGGLATALDWFGSSIGLDLSIPATKQVAMLKETLVLISMLLCLGAMFPLMELLLTTRQFASIVQPLPDKSGVKSKSAWRRNVVITIAIAGLTFPFMTQLGHGLLPLPEKIFRMTIGNGFLSWYGILIIVMLTTTAIGKHKAKKAGLEPESLYERGLSSAEKPNKLDGMLIDRCLMLAVILVLLVYAMTYYFDSAFGLDLRFIWPFFRPFNNPRFDQFCVYILFFIFFYVLNNSKIIAGMRTEQTYRPGIKGFLANWGTNFLAMAGGLLLITAIEYIPFFLGIGPGADLLFSPTFGGPFMSLLILFVPQVLFFSFLGTYCYRRTGTVLVGAFTMAILACWIVTGGSAVL